MSPRSDRRGADRAWPESRRCLYRVYGLSVESELELPELVPIAKHAPQVSICFGSVPESLEEKIFQWSWCEASRNEFLFTIKNVARYYVADGCRITIDRRMGLNSGVPLSDIRLWLLGSAFGALLHQRGLLPLHVSAVQAPTGVWAFTGESGEGKSTLAGFLNKRHGWRLVSDDVCVIDQNGVAPIIQPGPRKLKLWPDAMAHLGFNNCKRTRDLSNTEKFQIYLPGEDGYQPEALRAIVMLESGENGESATIQKLSGLEAFNACLNTVYRPYMDKCFKLPEQRIVELTRLCQSIEVFRFRRPRSLHDFESNLQPLLSLIGGSESS